MNIAVRIIERLGEYGEQTTLLLIEQLTAEGWWFVWPRTHLALRRLEREGYVQYRYGARVAERGGRPRVYVRLTYQASRMHL